MFQPIMPPDPPYEQGRPPSRFEVHQNHLDHIRQQRNELSHGQHRPSAIPLGGLVVSLRRSLGGMLIILGSWMSGEAARTVGPEAMARR